MHHSVGNCRFKNVKFGPKTSIGRVFLCPYFTVLTYRKNWENTEYASKGKKSPPEENRLQVVIILFMIPTQAPEFRLEFVTGRTGLRKMQAPGHFPRPAPLNGLGRSVFFGIPSPCPGSSPRPTHRSDGSRLKISGNKRGPVQGLSAGGPRMGAGR